VWACVSVLTAANIIAARFSFWHFLALMRLSGRKQACAPVRRGCSGDLARPEEIASSALFLVSDEASLIAGVDSRWRHDRNLKLSARCRRQSLGEGGGRYLTRS
jgi:NAD(P)-dependent dehydrogenase (short-subunit alcohol dehydrogenase family)